MGYEPLVEDIREALALPSSQDERIKRGIERQAQFLLRNYSFPKAITKTTTAAQTVGAQRITLAAGTGQMLGVRVLDDRVTPNLYKPLKRREAGVLPYEGGPAAWYQEGNELVLDRAFSEAGYKLEYWFMNVDPEAASAWMLADFHDALYYRCCFALPPDFRKSEVQQVYAPLWQEQMVVLAIYLNEVEFNGMDLRMGNNEVVFTERYPAN